MKTIEEKAKAYDRIVEQAEKEILACGSLNCDAARLVFRLLPDLKESEDERMMREFNDWLCEEIECRTNDLRDEKDRRTLNMLCYVLTKVKDGLEKQEQKPAVSREEILHQLFQNGSITLSDYLYLTEEQKSAWSEEDEAFLNTTICFLEGKFISDSARLQCIEKLRSLRPRPHWKPSKEQMGVFHNTMQRLLRAGGTGKWYTILESLYNQLEKL